MVDWLLSPVVSGAIGALGGYLNKRLELKALAEQNSHELAVIQANRDTSIAVAQLDRDKAELVGKLDIARRDSMAFDRSQKTSSPISDIIKSVIRPVILLAMGYLCFQNMLAVETMLDNTDALDGQQLVTLYTTIVVTIYSLFSMAVGWYFGERTSKITDAFMGILKR